MKRIIYLICFSVLIFDVSAKKDSTKIRSFRGIHALLYYSYGLGQYYTALDKYSTESVYIYEEKNFSFKTPNIGIGYVLNKHPFFIRTDISYSYGVKNLDNKFYGNSEDLDAKIETNQYNNMSIYFSNDLVGKRYYKFTDEIKGKINLHYIDVNMALGPNISPYFRPFLGWRILGLANSSFRATQKRTADLYEIKGYTSSSSVRDSLISSETIVYKDKRVKELSDQYLASTILISMGFSANFPIKGKIFLVEVQYDHDGLFGLKSELRQNYFSFRVSYVLKYSKKVSSLDN